MNSFCCLNHSFTIVLFTRIEISEQKLHNFLLESVRPNVVASFVLISIEFSSITFIPSPVTLTKRKATIVKFNAPARFTSREAIRARFSLI